MNRLKTGKILQMPSADQQGSVSETEARNEVRIQARDWNAYRDQLAAAAGRSAPEQEPAQQAAAGKVGAKVEEKAGPTRDAPQDVVKLSKGEPVAGATASDAKAASRVRALEEELVARDKAVKDASERVAKLEKTVKDLQALLEIKNKGLAELQKPAAAPAPATAPPAAPTPTPAPAPAPAPVTETKPAPAPDPAAPAAPKSEPAPPKVPPAPTKPKPVAKPSVPPPEPSLLDRVMDQTAYIGAGVGALLLIGALAVRAVKRRRESKSDSEDSGPARAGASAAAYSGTDTDLRMASPRAASDNADEVDPLAEAEIFLAYGRDAQAEELLKEALAATPRRHEVHVKLLQIYAKRKDVKAFEQLARELQQQTGGSGDLWDQATRLGYQIDPDNPRYAAGRQTGTDAAATTTVATAAAENVDFNIGFEDAPSATATDIDLGDSDLEKTQIFNPAESFASPDAMDMTPGTSTVVNLDIDLPTTAEPEPAKQAESGGGVIDFDFDLNALAPSTAAPESAVESSTAASGGIDFDMGSLSLGSAGEPQLASSPAAPEIDLSGISLDLGTETAPITSPTGKDDRWYDVQTKFDLAKAYQEMGDKDGARDILKEVLQEGDAEQKAAAQAVLSSLGA
jgi:pilus assembly protein FimV